MVGRWLNIVILYICYSFVLEYFVDTGAPLRWFFFLSFSATVAHMWMSEVNFMKSFFSLHFLKWASGFEFRLLGLHDKDFYPPSHLPGLSYFLPQTFALHTMKNLSFVCSNAIHTLTHTVHSTPYVDTVGCGLFSSPLCEELSG